MAETQWIEIAAKLGVPTVIIAACGWFFVKRFWPWVTGMVADAQAARERDLDRFAEQIGRVGKEQVEALRQLTEEIRSQRRGR